ncbi:MAG: hypothetical protein GXO75_07000 [Calditrichaeota bacterium]|nr:hypothetical protein [Calditrichota bacterium]
MRCNLKCYMLVVFFGLLLVQASDSIGRIRSKTPKLGVKIGTGYDTNIFRVSQASDSNRVEAPRETIDANLSWWIYWDRRIKTYLSTSGRYSNYQGNSFANEWDWKAKGKTFLALIRRPRGFRPGVKWMFEFEAARKDQIYTDRALGAENFLTLNGNGADQVPLKDLLDRSSFLIGSGFDIAFNRLSSLSLEYFMENNDYKNIDNPALQNTYSLDNVGSGFVVDFVVEPTNSTKIRLSYEGTDRRYEHKLARNLARRELADQQRRYWFDKYGLTLYWDTYRFRARLSASTRFRDDSFEGYYNYVYRHIGGNLVFGLPFDMTLSLGMKNEWKDYDNLTLADQVLQNRYATFDLGLVLPISSNFDFLVTLIHDRERSTFQKFTYDRNIILGGIVFGRGRY